MFNLSRRGWNNLLIFIVVVLIIFLSRTPNQLQQSPVIQNNLLPENTELLMVAFVDQRLIRAGNQWQLQPGITTRDANALAMAWQHTTLVATEVSDSRSRVPVAQASVQLAGYAEMLIWLLYPDEGAYLLQQAGKPVFYRISTQQAKVLFPSL